MKKNAANTSSLAPCHVNDLQEDGHDESSSHFFSQDRRKQSSAFSPAAAVQHSDTAAAKLSPQGAEKNKKEQGEMRTPEKPCRIRGKNLCADLLSEHLPLLPPVTERVACYYSQPTQPASTKPFASCSICFLTLTRSRKSSSLLDFRRLQRK